MNKKKLLLATLLVLTGSAFAQTSPAGLWKTIDDKSGKERSLVRISESAGVFSGRIEKRLDPNAPANEVCVPCTDDRKGKPVDGMEIIRGVKKNTDDAALWDGGSILDPENGKTYKVRLSPADGGKKLEVRGYIGMPMLGRTQTWIRVE
ncbi:DUF2147 domain-containing protein [Rivibacter subsaxonicus]|uniref:Uncharacterized protein DUF2147 n=1 Tax=Rivibacter subsaxonicus TaxID=457575 RepID=A0A4Q7VVQ5_9BURK|nr:DUF2147 domain-containing protein [Rivibacter subsaxonicus]RZU00508.1 uncharacterized protein DUF2147 [Rivibacter subsaxonicus]